MKIKSVWPLLKETLSEWSNDKASRLAAALAYYTIFSIAPLLVITIAVVGLVFGREAARGADRTTDQGPRWAAGGYRYPGDDCERRQA